MKLEVDEYYLNASGEIVKISEAYDNTHFNIKSFYYYDEADTSYFENGKVTGNVSCYDLIAHIPKPLHQFLLQQINDYYADEDFRLTVESVFGK